MSDDFQEEALLRERDKDACGYCDSGRVSVDMPWISIWSEIIEPFYEVEGLISSLEDLQDLLVCIKIGQAKGGSGEISCPICSGRGHL